MIKLEITDPHFLGREVLENTAQYLLALAGEMFVSINEVNSPRTEWKPHEEDSLPVEPELIEEEFISVEEHPMAVHVSSWPREETPVPSQVFAPPPPIPQVPGVELDSQGLPWDFRIHAKTKTKMKNGTWKKLRGSNSEVSKKIEDELKNVQSLPPAPPVAVPETKAPPSFSDLMQLVTKAITEGKLRRDQVTDVLKPFGIPSLPLVATRLDLIPAIMFSLGEVINELC